MREDRARKAIQFGRLSAHSVDFALQTGRGQGDSSTDALKDATFVVPYQFVQCRLVELLKHVAESVFISAPCTELATIMLP
jgi:hypothetical protein